MRFLVPAADLLVGARCAGCGGAALSLCRSCGLAIRPAPNLVWPDPRPAGLLRPTRVPPTAAGTNAGILQRVVIAWKEEGVTRLTDVLDHLLAAAVLFHARAGRPLVLVPVPTSRRSRRARGADLVDDLSRAAARRLHEVGVDVTVEQALGYRRTTRDQAGLGLHERRRNLEGAFRARPEPSGRLRDIVVVDDILTSGATVVEAVRALTVAGRRPVGIAAVAATPRRS